MALLSGLSPQTTAQSPIDPRPQLASFLPGSRAGFYLFQVAENADRAYHPGAIVPLLLDRMKIAGRMNFRARIFVVLTLVSVIPAVLTLIAGTMVLREVVVSTGSAGAWDEVAGSGRELFDEIEVQDSLSPELIAATERHQAALAESVRFSRLYAFLGERILVLLPVFALLLLGFVGGLALLGANWFSRGFSEPVEELVEWTRSLALDERLPSGNRSKEGGEIKEFAQLREALRATSEELGEARRNELEQARMRSWSQMARKIAHELKNPLTPMAIAADRVARAEDPSVSAAGEVLREEIQRLDGLARTFAQFGRPPEGPMSSIDLVEMLSSLVRRLSADGMIIRFDTPPGRVFVTGHLEALERVVRNLLSNAQDSVVAQASIDSRPGEVRRVDSGVDREPIRLDLIQVEETVEIQVLDRGTGIPEDILERIWEPEFTLKRKGTGLGLAMVQQVMRSHGGEVRASNREGGGAQFLIRMPLCIEGSRADPTALGEVRGDNDEDRPVETRSGVKAPA